MASFADIVLLPERPYSLARLREFILAKKDSGKRGLMVVVAEGAHSEGEGAEVAFRVEGAPQAERYGGIAWQLSRWIEKECDWEARNVVLGHLQRARAPTPTDRFLTLAMGVEAARMVIEGTWGQCTVYRQGLVKRAPIADIMGPARTVSADHRWVKLLESMGCFV